MESIHIEKLRELFSQDVDESTNQAVELLEALASNLNDICSVLQIEIPNSIDEWEITFPNKPYIRVWLLAKMAKYEVPWVLDLNELDFSGLGLNGLPEDLFDGCLASVHSLSLENNRLQSLPLGISKCTQMQYVNLRRNLFKDLPEGFVNLKHLQILKLGSNPMTTLPSSVQYLTSLRELYVHDSRSISLPNWIEGCKELEILSLRRTQVGGPLPQSLTLLPRLCKLDVQQTYLSSLPDWMKDLTQLQQLDWSGNPLSVLPDWIGELSNLHTLDLWQTYLKDVPQRLGELRNLKVLDFWGCRFTTIPEPILKLTNLETLIFSNNPLTSIPEGITQLSKLSNLQLECNTLTYSERRQYTITLDTGAELRNANQIKRLLFSHDIKCIEQGISALRKGNMISTPNDLCRFLDIELPCSKKTWSSKIFMFHPYLKLWFLGELARYEISWVKNMKHLEVCNTGLSILPDIWGSITQIQKLNLSNNEISELPPHISKCTHLEMLDVSNNKLTTLSESLAACQNITTLCVRGNALDYIPHFLTGMTSIQNLDWSANKLCSIPEWFDELQFIRELSLADNELSPLPFTLGTLTSLVHLDISGNGLYAQQDNYDVINQLVSLETLIVKNNKFSFFQKEIAQLTRLKILDVQENNISPRQLKRLQGYLPNCEIFCSEHSQKQKKSRYI